MNFFVKAILSAVLLAASFGAALATPGCDVIGGWPGAQYGGKSQILTDALPCYGITGMKDSPAVLQEAPTIHNPHFTGVVNCPTCGSGGAIVTNGSWTPVLTGSTTAGSPTYSSQIGQWSRVGDLVTVWFRVQITAPDVVAAGTAVVAGLPFLPITAPAQGYVGTPGPMSYVSHTTGYNQFSVQIKDTTGVTFQEFGDDVIISNMPIGNVHTNAIVGGSVTYRTSAP